MTGPAVVAFLSWTRSGLAGGEGVDPLSGPMPAADRVRIGYRVNEREHRVVDARVLGVADVGPLDEAQVLRTDPTPGDDTFPPHLFPQVEFDHPDLPWLLTPASAAERGRLRPWLVLVVVPRDRARLEPGEGRPDAGAPALSTLHCRREDLPDLAESHLWAHVQVALDGPLSDELLDAALHGAPARTLSRLVCPRRLAARVPYLACVVPAFEAGRKAGLGIEPTDVDRTTLTPAWQPGTGAAPPLPVYLHWEFTAGDDGSFEALAARLRGRPLPRTVGLLPVDVGSPGPGLPAVPGAVLDLEGALRAPGTAALPWNPVARSAFEAALRARVEPGSDGDDVVPPVYGLPWTGRRRFTGDGDAVPWLRQLNLDPRYRAVAALGTRAVQNHQEAIVAAAWDQVAELAEVNQTLRHGQLGRTVAQALHDRRVDPSRPGSTLPDDRLLQLTAPAHGALGTGAALAASTGLRAAASPAFGKATRPGGALGRAGGRAVATPMARLADGTVTVDPPLPVPAGSATVERLSAEPDAPETMRSLTAARVALPAWADAPRGPAGEVLPVDPEIAHVGDSMPNRVFATTVDGRVISRVRGAGGFGGWQDHGRPPGTTAVSAPATRRDLRAYVIGADGNPWSLVWDGDRWIWQVLPLNGGLAVRAGGTPLSTTSDSSKPDGVLVTTNPSDSLWVVGSDGALWEQENDDGSWLSHGDPGVPLAGDPGRAGVAFSVAVVGDDGWLYNRRWNADVPGWEWVRFGFLLNGPLSAAAPAGTTTESWYAAGHTPTDLMVGFRLFGSVGVWDRVRDDLGTILGVAGGSVYVSTTAGGVMRVDPGTTVFVTHLPTPPWFPPGSVLRGVVHADGTVFAVAGGHHLVGSGGQWQDLGPPTMAGRGDPVEAPPEHRRWRPVPGIRATIVGSHVDATPSTAADGDRIHVRAGSDVGHELDVRGGWTAPYSLPEPVGRETMGTGVALADVRGRGGDLPRRDLVVLWMERRTGGGAPERNVPAYRVGFDLDAGAVPASWSPVRYSPVPVSSPLTSVGDALSARVSVTDCDIDVVDLDDDGRPEIVMAYVSGHSPQRTLYRVGWCLDPAGDVTRGWSESQPLPPAPGHVVAIGVCVVRTGVLLQPDLVVLYVVRDEQGGPPTACYHVGSGINARGRVTGGWTVDPVDVEGGPLPTGVQGASLAAADVTGSEAADLVVFTVGDGPGENTGRYRIGRDVSAGTGAARTWTPDLPVPGWFGQQTRGAGVAVGDLDPALVAERTAFAQAFTAAAKAHQAALEPAQRLAAAEDATVPLADVAAAAREALAPSERIDLRVAARVTGVDLTTVEAADRLGPVLAAPSFDVPAYELVRDIARDLLLPGLDAVPPDTVSLLRASPEFVEAFMVGLNHETARELRWRELPADPTATFFRHFWDRGDGAPDLPPIAGWNPAARLGGSATGLGGPDMAVLVVRGELLRRHPDPIVSAVRAAFTPAGRELTATTIAPDFRASMDPDVTFFGFALTVAQARGVPGADPGWFFAFAEHPTEPRFGLDEPGQDPDYGVAPATWSDLDWACLAHDRTELDGLAHAPAGPPFDRGTELPVRAGSETFRWAENSAHTAHITLQRPFMLAVHATDLLPYAGEWQVTHVVRDRRAVRAVAGRHPGGHWWRLAVPEAAAAISRGERLYVHPPGTERAELVVVQARRPYLRTRGGGGAGNNLSALPDLPPDTEIVDG